MEAYLDNSATTRCSESVRDIMLQVMMEDYGNPSSLHLKRENRKDTESNGKRDRFYFRRYGIE